MPPSAIGCSMSNKSQIGVRIMQSSSADLMTPLAEDLRPMQPMRNSAIRRRAVAVAPALQAGDEPGVERIVRREHVVDRGDHDTLGAAFAHEARQNVSRRRAAV